MSTITLRKAEEIVNGIQMSDFEQPVFGAEQPHRLLNRDNIITTFRIPTFCGGWLILKVYGEVTDAELAVMRSFARSAQVKVQYMTTAWGKPLKRLSGLDWKVLS